MFLSKLSSHYSLIYTRCKISVLVSAACFLSTYACYANVFAPAPIIHDIMQEGLSIAQVLEKQAVLRRTYASYPALRIGGTIETRLVRQSKANICNLGLDVFQPNLETIRATLFVAINEDLSIIAPCYYSNHVPWFYTNYSTRPKQILLEQLAIIWGKQTKNYRATQVGDMKLPFQMRASLGFFPKSLLLFPSSLSGIQNEFAVHGAAQQYRHEWLKVEKHLKHLRSMFEFYRVFKSSTISLQVTPCAFNREQEKFKQDISFGLLHKFFGNGYVTECAASCVPYESAAVYGSMNLNHWFTFRGQRIFRAPKLSKRSKLKPSTNPSSQLMPLPEEGYLECSRMTKLSDINIPIEVIVGYSWPKNFSDWTHNPFYGVLKFYINDNIQAKIGIKVAREARRNHHEIECFMARLTIIF